MPELPAVCELYVNARELQWVSLGLFVGVLAGWVLGAIALLVNHWDERRHRRGDQLL